MAKKILKTLTHNLGFKVLACFLAFILWLVVYNIDDPRKTKTFTTNITIDNATAVSDMNKCYEIVGGTNTVTFTVTAKRSELDKISETDFNAVADMNRMIVSEDGESASVPIEISYKRNSSSLTINDTNKYMEVTLEDLMSHRFMISAASSGTVADGYALGEVTVTNPNVLDVSGPASIVREIDTVVATIDVDGMSVNLTDNVLPVLYDADGNEVDTTRLKLSNTTVTISAKILNIKEVPLVFSTSGKPYGDYRVVEITSTPEKVKVKGTSAVLNPMVSITIPSDVLNVSGATETISTTIDITSYLPEGVELVDSSDVSVAVTVRIEAYESKEIKLPEGNISVKGLAKGYKLSFDQSEIPVTISGLQADLDKLSVSDLKASVDVSDLAEGSHQVTLNVELDESVYAYWPITVGVQIEEKQSSSQQPDADTDNDTDVEIGTDGDED
jgi:YbbR domain-containing protein